MADGVESRLQFSKKPGLNAADEVRLVPEIRTPNWEVPLDDECSTERLAERVLDYFSDAHEEIAVSTQGRLIFQGLSTSFTVQCAVARDAADSQRAASLGASP